MSKSKLTFARVAKMIRPKVGCRLIFVYDDMMDAEVMAERVPDPEFICTARMESRRFLINTDGIASITPRSGFEVHGVIWQVEEIGVTCLDLQLGVPGGVDRFGGFSRNNSGKLIVSEFYMYRNRELGTAHPDYLTVILNAARKHGFPDDYIEQIERWDVDRQAA
jgi:hypothetical protein